MQYDNMYREYKILKKPGHYQTLDNGNKKYVKAKYRHITAPNDDLKEMQNEILRGCLNEIQISDRAFGFVKGKSIKDNAKEHIGAAWVLEIDLKDFFDTVTREMVISALVNNRIERPEAEKIGEVCTRNGTTPQGAPTSPALSNIVCKPMDKKIKSLASKNGCIYTRYADDITISTKDAERGYIVLQEIKGSLESIIQKYGFNINKSKTKTVGRHRRQSVTGIVINNSQGDVYPSREMRNKVGHITKMALRDLHEGTIKTLDDFEKKYDSIQKIQGQINFLHQVNHKQNNVYKERMQRIKEGLGEG